MGLNTLGQGSPGWMGSSECMESLGWMGSQLSGVCQSHGMGYGKESCGGQGGDRGVCVQGIPANVEQGPLCGQ